MNSPRPDEQRHYLSQICADQQTIKSFLPSLPHYHPDSHFSHLCSGPCSIALSTLQALVRSHCHAPSQHLPSVIASLNHPLPQPHNLTFTGYMRLVLGERTARSGGSEVNKTLIGRLLWREGEPGRCAEADQCVGVLLGLECIAWGVRLGGGRRSEKVAEGGAKEVEMKRGSDRGDMASQIKSRQKNESKRYASLQKRSSFQAATSSLSESQRLHPRKPIFTTPDPQNEPESFLRRFQSQQNTWRNIAARNWDYKSQFTQRTQQSSAFISEQLLSPRSHYFPTASRSPPRLANMLDAGYYY